MLYEIGKTSRLGNRKSNQDNLASIEAENGVVLILGDGLGGKKGGELASEVLVKTVRDEVEKHEFPIDHPERFLEAIIIQAHYKIKEAGLKQTPPLEPGTTAVVCIVQEGMAWWAHVGDSRCYLFRDGLSMYRTQDHSYVEELYQQGQLSMEKKDGHPMRNLVTQCIGLPEITPTVSVNKGVPLQQGDVILLCSDGFWEPLDDAQMGAILDEHDKLDISINVLAERAETASYPRSDNTSAVAMRLISIDDEEQEEITQIIEEPSSDRTSLQGAIDEIERALQEYSDEMKD